MSDDEERVQDGGRESMDGKRERSQIVLQIEFL